METGASIDCIYDDRGRNILGQLGLMISLDPNELALDVGCGLGQLAIALSTKYKLVVAADISRDALKVVRDVAKKSDINNVCPILLDSVYLPFRDDLFGLITCSGALEWVPFSHDSVSPEKLQVYALKEIRRILTKHGFFWLGIENRYSFNYLAGAVDHHSGLRFVTFLPRFVAKQYSLSIKKQPYKNYLYNYWELIKLLKNTGLTISKSLTAFPFYSNPKVLVNMDNSVDVGTAVMSSQLRFSLLYRSSVIVLSKLHLTRLFIPCFVILCSK